MCFQIVDDVLDVTASAEELGKPAGNDVHEGVYTLPVIYALQSSAELRGLLGRKLEWPEVETSRLAGRNRPTLSKHHSRSRVCTRRRRTKRWPAQPSSTRGVRTPQDPRRRPLSSVRVERGLPAARRCVAGRGRRCVPRVLARRHGVDAARWARRRRHRRVPTLGRADRSRGPHPSRSTCTPGGRRFVRVGRLDDPRSPARRRRRRRVARSVDLRTPRRPRSPGGASITSPRLYPFIDRRAPVSGAGGQPRGELGAATIASRRVATRSDRRPHRHTGTRGGPRSCRLVRGRRRGRGVHLVEEAQHCVVERIRRLGHEAVRGAAEHERRDVGISSASSSASPTGVRVSCDPVMTSVGAVTVAVRGGVRLWRRGWLAPARRTARASSASALARAR